tara:strand:- start:563 stop:853 length:291 start_codon:yes stop_codon:yes gene_type:complete
MIITNTKIDANMKFEDSSINELSDRSPFLLINTPCGIGKYRFNKVYHNEINELIFEYELVDDDYCKDTNIIKYYIGDCYYLSAVQVLYAFNYISNS